MKAYMILALTSYSLVLTILAKPQAAFALDSRLSRAIVTCARNASIINPRESNNCFSLTDDGRTYNLVEVHNRRCQGDPNITHTRAFFSFRGSVLGYEYGADAWTACP